MFQDWKGFVDAWERKAKDELADAINENMKIDSSSKSDDNDDDGPSKGQYNGGYHSRDHHDDQRVPDQRHSKNHHDEHNKHNKHGKQIESVKMNKDDSGFNYANQPTNWDWDKEVRF